MQYQIYGNSSKYFSWLYLQITLFLKDVMGCPVKMMYAYIFFSCVQSFLAGFFIVEIKVLGKETAYKSKRQEVLLSMEYIVMFSLHGVLNVI